MTTHRGGVDDTATHRPSSILDTCESAVALVGVDGAAISLMTDTRNQTVCSTDALARALEDLQLTLGEGPSVDAVRIGSPVLTADLCEPGESARWPGFTPEAVAMGVRATFSFPLRVGGVTLGAMDLCRTDPGALTTAQRTSAVSASLKAAVQLLYDADVAAVLGGAERSDEASYHQFQVHQATGMVTVQADVGLAQALLMLRARAFATRIPLVDVARDVVEGRIRFTQEN